MSQTSTGRVTEPLRAEHRHLLPHVEALAEAGDAIGVAPLAEQRAKVAAAHAFLAVHLIPHATAEDEVLYPQLDRLLGGRGGTRPTDTMRRDHVEVVRLTEQLDLLRERLHGGSPEPDEERELRRVLYGLHALVGLHFAKEEEVYLPLLDRELTADEAQELFERMERIGADSGAGHAH
jgi:iron-sulfur cluster repair protein YtfE (RIC family)